MWKATNFPTIKYCRTLAFPPFSYSCTHLLIEPFNPPIQILQLIRAQIITLIQRPIQVLRQHLLIKTLTRQSPRRIPSRKVLIWSSRPIEIAPRSDVVYLAAHSEVDGVTGCAVVLEEGAWGECLEDFGGWLAWEGDGVGGAEEAEVEHCEEEDEEGYVEGCGYCEAWRY